MNQISPLSHRTARHGEPLRPALLPSRERRTGEPGGENRQEQPGKLIEEWRKNCNIRKNYIHYTDTRGNNMILEYCDKAIQKAEYKKLEDGTWFAEIPGFQGVWANGNTVEACRKELITVLEEWLVLMLRDQNPILELDGLRLEIRDMAVA